MEANPGFQSRAKHLDRLVPNPKAKLRDQFHEVARYRQLSLRTEEAYWDWVHRFLRYWKEQGGAWRHPQEMAGPEVKSFLAHLATERNVAVSTQNQAFHPVR